LFYRTRSSDGGDSGGGGDGGEGERVRERIVQNKKNKLCFVPHASKTTKKKN
jgi:hypothetical protein